VVHKNPATTAYFKTGNPSKTSYIESQTW